MTMLRGKVMVEDGEFRGDLNDGQYLKRQIPQEIRRHRSPRANAVWAQLRREGTVGHGGSVADPYPRFTAARWNSPAKAA